MHEIVRLIFDAQEGRHIWPPEYAHVLGQDLEELERRAGVAADTALLEPDCEALQRYMRASLLVIKVLIRVSLDPEKALLYFKRLPVGELEDQTPEMLVSSGRTIDLLLRLDS
jgi:hypothetical protein